MAGKLWKNVADPNRQQKGTPGLKRTPFQLKLDDDIVQGFSSSGETVRGIQEMLHKKA